MGVKLTWIRTLWLDETGVILSTELVLMGSVLATGMVVGLASLRDTVTTELSDLAQSLSGLSQSYSYSGLKGCSAETAGSQVLFRGAEAEEEAAAMPQSCIQLEPHHSSLQRENAPPEDLPLSI